MESGSARRRATRRAFVATLGGLVTIGRSRPDGAAASPVSAQRGKWKNLRRSFFQTTAITIPDEGPANPFPSQLVVSGLKKAELRYLRIGLNNVTHSGPGDLDIMLESPNGRRAKIWSDAGALHPLSNFTVFLHDEALTALPEDGVFDHASYHPTDYSDGVADFTGPGMPEDTSNVALSIFRGINPNGTWKLWVVDDRDQDTGSIESWELDMDVRVPRRQRRRA